MSNNHSKFSYTFLDYEIIPSKRVVLRNVKPLKITKKCFDILWAIVQVDGNVITKDQLISEVWPNQIVTDAALNKLIMRLRKSLGDQNTDNPIIETVRGIGFRLIPKAVKHSREQVNIPSIPKSHRYIFGVVFLMLAVILFNDIFQKNTHNENANLPTDPINLAVIPSIKIDDWLNVGGLKYLSTELEQDNQLYVIAPDFSWFNLNNPNKLGIELTQSDTINYALMVENKLKGADYSSTLVLRNSEGIIAKTEIINTSMNEIFDQSKAWVLNQLSLSGHIASTKDISQLPTTDFALENYIRGWTANEKNEYSKAIKFFQTAIEEDPKFYQAWTQLALSKSRSGESQAAVAMVDTLLQIQHSDQVLISNLYAIKADALIFQNQLDEAQILVDQSMEIAETTKNIKAQIFTLSVQSTLYSNRTEPDERMIATLTKELELVQKYYPLPLLIARLNHNLGGAYWMIDDPDKAKPYLEKSIELFKQTQHITGQVATYIKLSDMAYYEGDSKQALLIIEKASPLIDQVENPVFKAEYLMAKSQSQAETGFRQLALNNLDLLVELAQTHASQKLEIQANMRKAVLFLLYKEYDLCKQTLAALSQLINSNSHLKIIEFPQVAALDIFVTARTEEPEIARTKLNTYLESTPHLEQFISTQIERTEAQILFKEGFSKDAMQVLEKLIEENLKKQLTLDAIQHGYELLEMQWQSNSPLFEVTLNQLQALTHFDYPVLKFRAQNHFSKNEFIKANALLEQLKSTANDFWTADDQLLLEEYQLKINDL